MNKEPSFHCFLYSETLSARKPQGKGNAFQKQETDEEKLVISLAFSEKHGEKKGHSKWKDPPQQTPGVGPEQSQS